MQATTAAISLDMLNASNQEPQAVNAPTKPLHRAGSHASLTLQQRRQPMLLKNGYLPRWAGHKEGMG